MVKIPTDWQVETAERSTCQYTLLRSSDRTYFVEGHGITKKEALKSAVRKIRKLKLENSRRGR